MVTLILSLVVVYLLMDVADNWNGNSDSAQGHRFFGLLLMFLVVFAITALNNGFSFPTDIRKSGG